MLASLAQAAASGGVVNFTNSGGTLGLIGNNPQIQISSAPSLVNNIIGGWAIVNGTDFASYLPTLGVGALGTAGFAGYDATLTNTFAGFTSNANANLKITVTGAVASVPTGSRTSNSLNLCRRHNGGWHDHVRQHQRALT